MDDPLFNNDWLLLYDYVFTEGLILQTLHFDGILPNGTNPDGNGVTVDTEVRLELISC